MWGEVPDFSLYLALSVGNLTEKRKRHQSVCEGGFLNYNYCRAVVSVIFLHTYHINILFEK